MQDRKVGGTHLGGWQTGKHSYYCLTKMISTWTHTDFPAPQLGNLQLELVESTAADKVAVQQLIDALSKRGRTAVRCVVRK